ncbi:MAG: chitobiase/beta-hexosaminidase C-terminal domain-containing protein [Terracidiphilus sp.]
MTSARFQISSVGAFLPPGKLSLITCAALFVFSSGISAQKNPQYGSLEACHNMKVGSPTYGPRGGDLNGFLPFVESNLWNTKIDKAPVDPNSAKLAAVWAAAGGYKLHPTFGASPADGGIPYIVVDSSETPKVPIKVIDYATESDVVLAPYPGGDTVPIEGDAADCAGWPDTYISDAHTLVLDRNTCWLYETFNTNRCNSSFNSSSETIFDMTKNQFVSRPWGWTSADAAGLSIFAGLVRYDEAASGVINHALRFTMEHTEGDSNGGYFVLPASHAASSNTTPDLLPMGTRLRLKANVDISSFSPINQAILTAMKTYGLILADNGSNFFVVGDTDPRWDDSDLGNLHSGPHAITSADFEVVQMTPEYPGMDSATAPTKYPGTVPVIESFTSSETKVAPGTPVTFDFHVTGSTYAYIDNIGPVRLESDRGSVTITPRETQTYTLYALNTSAVNNAIQSTPIRVTVHDSEVAPPTFTTPGGRYASNAPLSVTLNTTSAGDATATYYYTTDGTTPTTKSTKYIGVACSNAGPACNSNPDSGSITPITVSHSETLKAIAVVPGYSKPSAVSTVHYTIGSAEITDTPVFNLSSGTYDGTQTVYLSDATNGTDGNGNTIYYTTDGSTPTTSSTAFTNNNGCYGCLGAGPITVSKSETIRAIAVAAGYADSAVATATYTIRREQH